MKRFPKSLNFHKSYCYKDTIFEKDRSICHKACLSQLYKHRKFFMGHTVFRVAKLGKKLVEVASCVRRQDRYIS